MIEIIGAPFDLCGMRLGSRLGPAALRLAGLAEGLAAIGLEVQDAGDVAVSACRQDQPGIRNFGPLLETVVALQKESARVLAEGDLPLVIGGEHTLAVGGISAALNRYGENLGLLWIDAHADVNTPGTSPSGNVHGMPIAALAGEPSGVDGLMDRQWQEFLAVLGPGPCLDLGNTGWFGLRDVDPGEKARLSRAAVTMHDIDRNGVEGSWKRCSEYFEEQGITHLWISFDVDVLDPILAPGTGTAVRGGLSYREAHLLAELIHEDLQRGDHCFRLAGLDVVETNPIVDTMNQTAIVAVEWVASLFGKRIL